MADEALAGTPAGDGRSKLSLLLLACDGAVWTFVAQQALTAAA